MDSGWNEDTGRAYVVLRSATQQEIKIGDGGFLESESQTPATTTRTFSPGETIRMETPVTVVEGRVAVLIRTESDWGGEIIRPQRPSPFEETGSVAGWLGGASCAIVMGGWSIRREMGSEPDEPEQME
jgi:hypothetical protein